jgi:hypothetical protein
MKTTKMMPKGLNKTVKGEMKPTRMKPVGAKKPAKAPTTKGKK